MEDCPEIALIGGDQKLPKRYKKSKRKLPKQPAEKGPGGGANLGIAQKKGYFW